MHTTCRWKCWPPCRLHPCRDHQAGFRVICKGLRLDLQEGLQVHQEDPQHLRQGLLQQQDHQDLHQLLHQEHQEDPADHRRDHRGDHPGGPPGGGNPVPGCPAQCGQTFACVVSTPTPLSNRHCRINLVAPVACAMVGW